MTYDLIIIGLGPAGITAGIYAKRQNLNCVVVGKSFGGQMMSKSVEIENYPGFEKITGYELMERMKKHLESLKVDIEEGEVLEIEKNDLFKVKLDSDEILYGKSIIIATGANHKELNIEGESDYLGKGVSYCTTCDGPLFRGKDVVIIGGGDAGFEAARFLSTYTNKIYILEKGKEPLASMVNQNIVSKDPKIEIICNADIKKIEGKDFVEKIVYEANEENKVLQVGGVFIQIGYTPASDIFRKLVSFNNKKEIITNPDTCETNVLGIFAAGDVSSGRVKQIITACSDGAKAALSAYKYLNNK
ncbi:FAD-dependent oxidoreductase [bacterium]|nr:FAD-dependent oxidoreductase [bacterium]